MKMTKLVCKTIFSSLLGFIAAAAYAAPQITLSVIAEKDVEITDEKGNVTVERQEFADVAPGETIYYTLTYSNTGDEAAKNVKLDNPIADGNVYVDNSAWGDDADILFSIDGGQTFKKPAALQYSVKDSKTGNQEAKEVSPEEFTNIRWVIETIDANSTGKAGFSAVVK